MGADGPRGVGVNPSTNRVYVTAPNSPIGVVVAIDGSTNSVSGTPIPVGVFPSGIAANPSTLISLARAGDQR